jgi:hypothetical protein
MRSKILERKMKDDVLSFLDYDIVYSTKEKGQK